MTTDDRSGVIPRLFRPGEPVPGGPRRLSRGLGLAVVGGRVSPLIPAGTALPASVQKIFTTVKDEQQTLRMFLVAADDDSLDDPIPLGSVTIKDIPPVPAGQIDMEVSYLVDEGGGVFIVVRDLDTLRALRVDVHHDTKLPPEDPRLGRCIDACCSFEAEAPFLDCVRRCLATFSDPPES